MSTVSTAAPPQLRAAKLDDWEQIHRLELRHFEAAQPWDEWSRLWLENPLWPRLGERWPIGWVLEDAAGTVVGSLLNIPTLYHFRGRELINATGRGWAVDSDYRGYALWLLDEYYNQPDADVFINNTINKLAEQAHRGYAAHIPLGKWDTVAYWVTGYRGFARKVLEMFGVPLPGILGLPAAAGLWLKDALRGKRVRATQGDTVFATAPQFDARFDAFWLELVEKNPGKLLAARDLRTLTWHYAVLQRTGRLWIHTAVRDGQLRAYCVFKRQDGKEGIPRMRLVDFQTLEPQGDLLAGMLEAALQRAAAEDIHVLEHHGAGLPGFGVIDRCAPYRRKWSHWPYSYHAADPALLAELRAAEVWCPTSYDGDASFD